MLKEIFDSLAGAAAAFTDRYREDIRRTHEQAQQKIGIDLRAQAATLQTLPDWAAVTRELRQRSDLFTNPLQSELAYGRTARGWLRAKIPSDQAASEDRIQTIVFQKVCDDDGKYTALKVALQTNILTPGTAVSEGLLTAAVTGAIGELGDVLFQVVLHSALAEEDGRFSLAEVAATIAEKMIRRHPHVFAGLVVDGAEELRANWEAIKALERGDRVTGPFDGVSDVLPAALYAAEVLKAAERNGIEQPIIDPLLAAVDAARRSGDDPEVALRQAALKYRRLVLDASPRP